MTLFSSPLNVLGSRKKHQTREKDARLYVRNKLLLEPYEDCACLLSNNLSIAVGAAVRRRPTNWFDTGEE